MLCVCTCGSQHVSNYLCTPDTSCENTHKNDMKTNKALSGKSTVSDDIINLYYLFRSTLMLFDFILNFYNQS